MIALSGVALGVFILAFRYIHLDGQAWSNQGTFTLFAISFIFSGCQMAGMGILGEYIARIYNDVRARPLYFVEKVLGRSDMK